METGARVAASNGTMEQKIVYAVSQCPELEGVRPVEQPGKNPSCWIT